MKHGAPAWCKSTRRASQRESVVLALGASVFALFVPSAAQGQPASPSRIVVVRWDVVFALAARRLVGELREAGFTVITIDAKGTTDEAERALRADHDAFATVALAAEGKSASADVAVVDPATHGIVVRHLANEEASDVLAIHAAELLRASLFEVAIQPGVEMPADVARWLGPLPEMPAPAEPTPPPAVDHPAPPLPPPRPVAHDARETPPSDPPQAAGPKKHAFWLGLGAVVQGSYGGLPAAFGPVFDVRYETPIEWLELDLRVAAPVATSDVSDPSQPDLGAATVRHGQADVIADVRAFSKDAPVRPSFGLGLGAHLIDVNGELHSDFVSFTPSATIDVEFRLHERVHAFVGMTGIFTIPEPVIVFVNDRVAHAGEPMILGSASVAIGL